MNNNTIHVDSETVQLSPGSMMKKQQIQLNKQQQTYENAVRMIRQSLENYGTNRYKNSTNVPLVTQDMIDSLKEQSLHTTERD